MRREAFCIFRSACRPKAFGAELNNFAPVTDSKTLDMRLILKQSSQGLDVVKAKRFKILPVRVQERLRDMINKRFHSALFQFANAILDCHAEYVGTVRKPLRNFGFGWPRLGSLMLWLLHRYQSKNGLIYCMEGLVLNAASS
jgi:hypothetical protein